MKTVTTFMIYSILTIFITAHTTYAGKAGAAIGGFIGGTIVGSALSRPQEYCYPRETVIVHEPIHVASNSNGRLRRENKELLEDNYYLQDENNSLNRKTKQLQQELDALENENLTLKTKNKQLHHDVSRLENELQIVKKELNNFETKKTITDKEKDITK